MQIFLQVSKWQSGCYTLLHDEDADSCEYALDVWLFLGADNWQLSHGGQISYVALGEDEEVRLSLVTFFKKETKTTRLSGTTCSSGQLFPGQLFQFFRPFKFIKML